MVGTVPRRGAAKSLTRAEQRRFEEIVEHLRDTDACTDDAPKHRPGTSPGTRTRHRVLGAAMVVLFAVTMWSPAAVVSLAAGTADLAVYLWYLVTSDLFSTRVN